MTQTSVTWKLISPQDEPSLIALYDLAFGVPSSSHFTDDFPVWNPRLPVSGRTQLGGFAGSRLVATASSRQCETVEGSRIEIIGGVVVHPEFRGKGIATEGVSQLLAHSPNAETPQVLWGSEKMLYGRFGFVDAGVQKRAPLSAFQFLKPGVPRARGEVESGWNERITRGLEARRDGLKMTEDELTLIRSSKNIQWLSIALDSREAFAAIGKGIDLQGIVHTWGGDPALLGELFEAIRTQISEHFEIIWHPSHEDAYAFLNTPKNFVREVLLMLRSRDPSLDPAKLWFWGTDSA